MDHYSGQLTSCPLSLYGYYIWWEKVGHYVLYLINQVKPDIYDTTNCVPHYYLFYMTSHIICRRQILLYVITYSKITYHHLIVIHPLWWGTNYNRGFLWWGNYFSVMAVTVMGVTIVSKKSHNSFR